MAEKVQNEMGDLATEHKRREAAQAVSNAEAVLAQLAEEYATIGADFRAAKRGKNAKAVAKLASDRAEAEAMVEEREAEAEVVLAKAREAYDVTTGNVPAENAAENAEEAENTAENAEEAENAE